MGRASRAKKMAKPRVQCRALLVQMVLETVTEQGEVLSERVTTPVKLLRHYWPNLSADVEQAVQRFNAKA